MDISISRDKVMGIVEGLSVIIAQKSGEKASFEQLWASEDERLKLDIYYREAVSDLERHLMKWLKTSSGRFSLDYAAEGDYTLHLTISRWPTKLEGLLGNKIQDYLVHSILAGWLNNIAGIEIKSDYATIAGQDLNDVRTILEQRVFDTNTETRHEDTPAADATGVVAEERHENDSISIEDSASYVSDRKTDAEVKNRAVMYDQSRRRKRDMMPVFHHREETDWSGEGIDEMRRMMLPDRPHTVIIREPIAVIPAGKPLDAVMRPCKHRCAPFEMPPEDPNTPDADATSEASQEYEGNAERATAGKPAADATGVVVETRKGWEY